MTIDQKTIEEGISVLKANCPLYVVVKDKGVLCRFARQRSDCSLCTHHWGTVVADLEFAFKQRKTYYENEHKRLSKAEERITYLEGYLRKWADLFKKKNVIEQGIFELAEVWMDDEDVSEVKNGKKEE